jgi:protein-disulfide isomerase-like protein with CxxC motif
MITTATEVMVGGVQAETTPAAKKSKSRAKRRSFKEVRAAEREAVLQGQRAYYEPKLQELSEEIGLMQGELEAHRETLAKISGSWLAALRYWAKGHV